MINLIPPAGHKVVKQEYFLRVGATFCFLFGWVFVFLAVAMIPMYVLVKAQTSAFVVEINKENESSDLLKSVDAEVLRAKEILVQLKKNDGQTISPSTLIGAVQAYESDGITFKAFYLREEKGVIKSLQVQGVASTREALSGLKNKVEALDFFGTASVPIADLARGADLPFVMTIEIPQKK